MGFGNETKSALLDANVFSLLGTRYKYKKTIKEQKKKNSRAKMRARSRVKKKKNIQWEAAIEGTPNEM